MTYFKCSCSVPYDKSRITLSKPSGNPPTTYINASLITFRDSRQRFIATQAPKKMASFQNFWEMVAENKVRVVVMITALEEKGIRKAEQYWPMSEGESLVIGRGVSLELLSTSYQGTFYHRYYNYTVYRYTLHYTIHLLRSQNHFQK